MIMSSSSAWYETVSFYAMCLTLGLFVCTAVYSLVRICCMLARNGQRRRRDLIRPLSEFEKFNRVRLDEPSLSHERIHLMDVEAHELRVVDVHAVQYSPHVLENGDIYYLPVNTQSQ